MVASRISCTLAALLALLVVAANAQRGRTYLEESEVKKRLNFAKKGNHEYKLLCRPQYGRRPPPKPQPIDVVSDFPYEGGERAIFHFDEGDEKFLDTIGPLIKVIFLVIRRYEKSTKKQHFLLQGLNEMSGQVCYSAHGSL